MVYLRKLDTIPGILEKNVYSALGVYKPIDRNRYVDDKYIIDG